MQCHQCGAELRAGARFCNHCGAPQPADAVPIATAETPSEATAAPSESQPAAPPSEVAEATAPVADESARAKRPARIPRVREEGEPAETEELELANGMGASAAPPTAGDEILPLAGATEGGYLDDGLSWPLPPNIIVGGRYRIEAVVSVAAGPAGENVYRAKDLQGYERCWSCGATYEVPERAAPEQFCRECGADMLGRPYILRERLLSANAAPDATPDEAPLPGEHVFQQGLRRFSVEPEEPDLPPFPLGARVIVAAASDIGRGRAAGQNEDGVGQLVLQIETESRSVPLSLAVVADGLGGHASGAEASRLVVRTVLRHVLNEVALSLTAPDATPPTRDGLKQMLRDAIEAANAALHAANDESKRDMGSTIVTALIYDDTALVANVGDSRAYVFDGGTLRRLTADHSLVEQLVAGGMIEPEERYTHPNRNQIFRSLGVGAGSGTLGIDFFTQRLRPRMRLLLCSDGLWEMVHDEELARILRETPNPQAACDALIRAANEHGGEDNISALVVEISA